MLCFGLEGGAGGPWGVGVLGDSLGGPWGILGSLGIQGWLGGSWEILESLVRPWRVLGVRVGGLTRAAETLEGIRWGPERAEAGGERGPKVPGGIKWGNKQGRRTRMIYLALCRWPSEYFYV